MKKHSWWPIIICTKGRLSAFRVKHSGRQTINMRFIASLDWKTVVMFIYHMKTTACIKTKNLWAPFPLSLHSSPSTMSQVWRFSALKVSDPARVGCEWHLNIDASTNCDIFLACNLGFCTVIWNPCLWVRKKPSYWESWIIECHNKLWLDQALAKPGNLQSWFGMEGQKREGRRAQKMEDCWLINIINITSKFSLWVSIWAYYT